MSVQHADQRDARPRQHAVPAVLGFIIAGPKSGLGYLAPNAAGKIDCLSDDIAGVGRAGGK
jgi:hypothetical protein